MVNLFQEMLVLSFTVASEKRLQGVCVCGGRRETVHAV